MDRRPAEGRHPTEQPVPVKVSVPIPLGQFLKAADLVSTGGEAKQMVSMGLVLVNGVVETRRGRKLGDGDIVEYDGATVTVMGGAVPHVAGRPAGVGDTSPEPGPRTAD